MNSVEHCERVQRAIESERQNLEEHKKWLDTLNLPAGSLLDIGCGPGLHCKYFASRGMTVVGLDRSPELFQFKESIEFVAGDSLRAVAGRQFDYVFASHVLEHCPNTFLVLREWRETLRPGGKLLVIVPRYSPYVANDHWIIGWNVGQLAMSLVASGFDCSDSVFMQFGEHVCGAGVKRDFPATSFNIRSSLPYLPSLLTSSLSNRSGNELLLGEVISTEGPTLSRAAGDAMHVPLANADLDRFRSLVLTGDWLDEFHHLKQPLDLLSGPLYLLAFVSGRNVNVRLAVGSMGNGFFSNAAEIWFALEPGVFVQQIHSNMFRILRGQPKLGAIDHWAFGGKGDGTSIRFALIQYNGTLL